MKAKVRKFICISILCGLSYRAFGQDDDFDIPPPPPMEDYEEGPIETPYEDGDIIDGPVYEVPPGADIPPDIISPPTMVPGGVPPMGTTPGGMIPRGGNGGAVFTGGGPGGGGNFGGSKGGAAFGGSEEKVKFQIVEGEYWEKGKKRTRGKKSNQ